MGQYTEGQRLQGSDGNVYVVQNGVPVRVGGLASPKAPYEAPQAAATLQRTQQEIQQGNATAASTAAKAAAEAKSAQIAAQTAQEAYDAAHPKGTGSTVFGPAFLKTLGTPDAELVKALADGRLAFPGGFALKAPWWQQKLEQVAQYDPSFDATNFNNRAKARATLLTGKVGTSANSLNTAIGHLGHLADQAAGTASHGPWSIAGIPIPGATTVNAVENAVLSSSGQSGITNFQDTAQKLADELETLYRPSGGSEPGVIRQLRSLDPNMSAEQKRGIISNALELAASKQAANLYQYNIGSGGKPPVDLLDPQARAVLDQYPGIRDKYFTGPSAPLSRDAVTALTAHGGTPPPTGGAGGSSPPGPPPTIPGPPPSAAPPGSTMRSLPIPDAYQQANAQYLAQHWGKIDPQDYARFRAQEDKQFGFSPDPAAYAAAVPDLNKYATLGGSPTGLNIPPVNAPMSKVAQFRNDLVSNPVGAGVVGYGDAVSFGIPTRLAGDQMGALYNAHPFASTAGAIAGTLTGEAGLAKLGNYAERLAPRAIETIPGFGMFGRPAVRNIALDTTYGGAYGAGSGQGAGQDALLAGAGSIAGRGAGRLAGAAIGGLETTAPAQYLRNLNIPMTMGQKLGGVPKAIEDKATSLPLVGDMINARRMEGLQAFNQQALDTAGQPIGYSSTTIGKPGYTELLGTPGGPQGAVGQAYDAATAGASVPFDPQFSADLGAARQAGAALPPDLSTKFNLALQNRVDPIFGAGEMTGDQYQQAIRGLKGYKAESPKPGFESDYRGALTQAQQALTDQMTRGGGDSVVTGLSNADASYRMGKTVQNAADRADGADYMFTPSQLQDAVKATQRKYPGPIPLADLADAGQAVLPSRVPDSGTGGRLAQMALGRGIVGGGLIGTGAGAGYLMGGGEGAQTGAEDSALASALLLAGGTRTGQNALDALAFSRPDIMRTIGSAARRRLGMFGTAGVPIAIQAGNWLSSR